MSKKKAVWLVLLMALIAAAAFLFVSPPAEARPLNCAKVRCAVPDCLEGEHLEIPSGQCCPICVPD